MLLEAQTIVQGVNLGVVLIIFFVLYRAAQEDSPLQAKAKWAFFLSGVFLVGIGLLAGVSERSVSDMLLMKYFGLGAGAICLGYSFVILSVVCVFRSTRADRDDGS